MSPNASTQTAHLHPMPMVEPSIAKTSGGQGSAFNDPACAVSCGYTDLFTFWGDITDKSKNTNGAHSDAGSTAASTLNDESSICSDSSDATPIRAHVHSMPFPLSHDSSTGNSSMGNYAIHEFGLDSEELSCASLAYSEVSGPGDEEDMPLNPIAESTVIDVDSLSPLLLNLSICKTISDDNSNDDSADADDSIGSFDPKDFLEDESDCGDMKICSHLSTIEEGFNEASSTRTLRSKNSAKS